VVVRSHRVAIIALVVAFAGGGAAACNSLLGIQGGTPRPAVTQLAAGAAFACALLADGTVWCWGADDHLQLGHLDLDADVPCRWAGPDGGHNVGLCSVTPTQVVGLSGVTQIAVGADFACALLGTGEVDCWGANDQGQLGPLDAGEIAYRNCPTSFFDAATTRGAIQCTPVPNAIKGLPKATAITAGTVHACASTKEGVYCWGSNNPSILDNPTLGPGPVLTKDVPAALQLTAPLADPPGAYNDNTCALISPKSTICWGPNSGYDDGCMHGTNTSVCKLATTDVASIHLGGNYGCMLGSSGSLECWGTNNFFIFDTMNVGSQVQTPTLSDYVQTLSLKDEATASLFDGRSSHALVVDTVGRLWAWGDNTFGQIGIKPSYNPSPCFGGGTGGFCVSGPVGVSLADGGVVSAIATGVDFSLALTSDGTVWAWGANTEGQLGYLSDGKPCVKLDAGAEPCNWVPSPIQVPP